MSGCPMCGQTECSVCEGAGEVWVSDIVTDECGCEVDYGYHQPCVACDGEGYE